MAEIQGQMVRELEDTRMATGARPAGSGSRAYSKLETDSPAATELLQAVVGKEEQVGPHAASAARVVHLTHQLMEHFLHLRRQQCNRHERNQR